MLVVVEHRHLERLDEPALDLEADRRLDVLELDRAEAQGDVQARSATISSGSRVSSTIGKAERPANWWSSAAFPSITGSEAIGPTLPRPSTRVPFVTIATVLPRIVNTYDSSGSRTMVRTTSATPGV